MDGKDLGRIIKAIRIKKKMTQSEVVGTYITRNMLSKIESGKASPSLATLEYLAKALDVPLSMLLPDDNTNGTDVTTVLIKAKAALDEKEYEQAIKLADKLPSPLSDEKEAISAKAYLAMAKNSLSKNEFDTAVKNAKLAFDKAKTGLYSSRELQTEALIVIDSAYEKIEKRRNKNDTGRADQHGNGPGQKQRFGLGN